ncbi:dihydrofolate synthetase isoform X3 [Nymphaea colorata]|uniref:dihydrofolate synthetase isoform X3 n=1 Tax=Nymphaea colorata TaxID=210225 RepID=UPI00129DBEEA|nr:dihydrofolate synthetase isoform X3 [Nymphaea colorata]
MQWIRVSSFLTFDRVIRLRTTRISTLLSATSICRDWMLGRRWFSSQSEDPRLVEFVDYLETLKNYEKLGVPKGAGTDSDDGFDLGRMRRLLHSLGNPHLEFKAVHIAGTKGKGSTAQFISNILRKQGYTVGCYTSPHLRSIRERMSLGSNGEIVSVETLNNLFYGVKSIVDQSIQLEKGSLTHFEVLTALAFTLFAQQKVDIAVVETGLGGARDATNVLPGTSIAASVITTIDEEHLSALGGSLESIAIAKSGIIKEGCPFAELLDVKLQMLGRHQLQNSITAACTALVLRNQGWEISGESIHAGLEDAFLLGRSQFLSNKEAELLGISGTSVLIDGAHTEAAVVSLANMVQMTHMDYKSAVVVAMASDKNHSAFANQLLSGLRPDIVVFTETSIAGSRSRAMTVSSLKEIWTQLAKKLEIDFQDLGMIKHKNQLPPDVNKSRVCFVGCKSESVKVPITLASALLRCRMGHGHGVIIVTGSLHIVGAVLGCLDY